MTLDFLLTELPEGFHDDPYPHYREMRERAPVHPQPDGSFVLSRHADLDRVYKDARRFISDKKAVFGPKYGLGTPLYLHHTTSLVFNDAPLHTRVRAIMTGALTPRALASMEPALVALVNRLVDELEGRGEVDLVTDYATEIPIEVIGNLFAIPNEERGPLRGWSLAILGALEPALTAEQEKTGNRAVTDFSAYLDDLIARRRRQPGDPVTDVLTRLIQSEAGALSHTELVQNCIFILNAGHETTTNLIGNALAVLARNEAARAALLAERQLIQTGVDEFLRYESPNQFGNRMTTEEVEISGIAIPAGTDLHLCIGGANRDPEQFEDPETLKLDRRPNRHFAFAAGPHVCVGLTLARMEGRIAISRFLERFPEFELTGPPERPGRLRFRGLDRLPARLNRRRSK